VEAADSPVAGVADFLAAVEVVEGEVPEEVGEIMKAQEFLNQLQHDDIVAAIRQAEGKTSGEIRVLISHKKVTNPIAATEAEFLRLGMTKTKEKNGVLIFVAPRSRNFAIIGDKGVHNRCGDAFWREVADEMTARFRKSKFTEAILHGIRKAGDLLAQHFPRGPDDRNELPDEIARG
jgi:uncharacterized membrane protein